MNSQGRKLHEQALTARESGEYLKSLTLNDQALFAYDLAGDAEGFAEGLANRSITLRDKAELEPNSSVRLLVLAKHEIQGAVEIAKLSQDPHALVLPLLELAKVQGALGEFQESVISFKRALENYQQNPTEKIRPAQLADMRVHLADAEYKTGDRSALLRLEAAVQDLERANEADVFSKEVWLSGGYMNMAESLQNQDQKKSMEYLQKAKNIIDRNPKLVIRKRRLNKLTQKLSF